MKPIIVIAGTHMEFLHFQNQHPKLYLVEADDKHRLYGRCGSGIILVGSCRERKDYNEILQIAWTRIR